MKTRFILLIGLLLVLSLALSACGGGAADNAKKFIEAGEDGDRDEAEKYVCDDPDVTIEDMLDRVGEETDIEYTDIDCEEEDDEVVCKVKTKQEEEELTLEATFRMEDDKVCELKGLEVVD